MIRVMEDTLKKEQSDIMPEWNRLADLLVKGAVSMILIPLVYAVYILLFLMLFVAIGFGFQFLKIGLIANIFMRSLLSFLFFST